MTLRSDDDTGTDAETAETQAVPPAPPSHLSAEAWSEIVDGLQAEAGSTIVHDLTISETEATALVPDGDTSRSFTYRGGEWTSESSSVQAPQTVDLAAIDPQVVAGLPAQALSDLDATRASTMSLLVNDTGAGAVLSIFAKVDDSPATRSMTYDTEGRAG